MSSLKPIFQNDRVKIARDRHGVPHVEACSEIDLYWGVGYCHAWDRGMQMLLMRILGRGQASQFLAGNDDMLALDKFFRRMNWYGGLAQELATLSGAAQDYCQAYSAGANAGFDRRLPWELRMLGYQPPPWQNGDILLLARMAGYLTLAQSQAEIERLCIEMIQAGVPAALLEELFPDILHEYDEGLIKQIKLAEPIIPAALRWNNMLPRLRASNNWVISGARAASGKPMLANDPHLETNRLPNVWCELVLQCGERYAMGATMPGLPTVLIGRTNDLAWGATYTFMDAVDSWIEQCQEGKFRYENEWRVFRQRREIIHRKKKTPVEIVFHENNHGVLEGNPWEAGFYLTTKWAPAAGGAASLNHAFEMLHAQNVAEGMECLGGLEMAMNWVLADRHGNIGYQMSGVMPKRRPGVSGFLPLPGWKTENDWQGLVAHQDLPRCLNPAEGFFVTANNDLNSWGIAKPINNSMGWYRADRIGQLLAQHTSIELEDMQKIHYDVYSLQAECFMKILRPLLPETPLASILREWDCCYDTGSRGAFLFETVYQALLQSVFGEKTLGKEIAEFLAAETGIFADFFNNFDRILLAEESSWFGDEGRDGLYRRILAEALQISPKMWGEVNQLRMAHILLGNQLPLWAGFDHGPIPLRGGRATPHQGQIYRSAGRTTSFTPSFRMIADLSRDELHTNLAGGPSDRRFSKWYYSDLKNWRGGKYKVLEVG